MTIYEKFKLQFENFDLNTTLQSAFAILASMTIDNVLSWVYVGLALMAFRHNAKLSMMKQDLETKKLESEGKKIDIENRKLTLENERYSIETEMLKAKVIAANKENEDKDEEVS